MRTLLILRHAKSSWSDRSLDDHDRPLNPRGLRDAPRVGRWMKQQALLPDLVVSSTAVRARETARLAMEAAGYAGEIRLAESFYLASPATYLRAIEGAADSLQRILVVGHNPGMEDLVARLTGRHETMPTAALAVVSCPAESWGLIDTPPGRTLERLWRVKELPAE